MRADNFFFINWCSSVSRQMLALKYLWNESISKSVNVWKRLSRLLLIHAVSNHLMNTHDMLVIVHSWYIMQLIQAKSLFL